MKTLYEKWIIKALEIIRESLAKISILFSKVIRSRLTNTLKENQTRVLESSRSVYQQQTK